MDGLPPRFRPLHDMSVSRGVMQRTLKSAIDCVGVGLHGGKRVTLTLRPAPVNTGILFRRVDLGVDIPARYDLVTDTKLCTVLSAPDGSGARVGTVEHLMAALAGAGISNVIVEVNGPELPIFDGSASSFVFLIECAGSVEQAAGRDEIVVLRTVRVQCGDAWAELRPCAHGLEAALSIAFESPAIGAQAMSLKVTPESFREDLADARTFALRQDIDALQAAGLAQGGSLDNAIVVDGATILNPGGLRSPDEFVRHKLLDAVGDLALAGAPLRARLIGHRSGHAINNQLLRALFADDANWRLVPGNDRQSWVPGSAGSMAGAREQRLALAAAPI